MAAGDAARPRRRVDLRGRQYARAIALFQRKYANAYPPNLDVLLDQKYLRRRYSDPMAKGEDKTFQLLYQTSQTGAPGQGGQGQSPRPGMPAPGGGGPATPPAGLGGGAQSGGVAGGVIGVASKSKERSIRIYNGRSRYNEWQFLAIETTQRPGGAPGTAGPPSVGNPGLGPPGRPGRTQPQVPSNPAAASVGASTPGRFG